MRRTIGRRWWVGWVVALLAPMGIAGGQEARATLAGRSVVIWTPPSELPGPRPVIVFSHGFGGCAIQSRFLTRELARHGYWVVAPNHADSRCGSGPAGRLGAPFRTPENWSDTTYAARRDDIRAILAAITDSGGLRRRLDLTRVGLVGHSLGGYTVLGLAGAWPSWTIPNVRAVLALSPFSDPYLVHNTLDGLKAPVMYQTGTLDAGINPSLKRSNGVYDRSPAPKYYVELSGAGHLAWTGLRRAHHDPIVRYSIAFLDMYVLGGSLTNVLSSGSTGVSELRYKSELGEDVIGSARRRRR